MTGRLDGKVAVITGACSGIGLGAAELFIAEGARVIAADIAEDRGKALEERFRGRLRFARCDVTLEKDVAGAIALGVREFGGLDVTFNNAGCIGTTDSIENLGMDGWDQTMNVLLRGVIMGIKHSVKPMRARGGGSIINTSSISGITTSGPVGYCVAKAAVIQLTRVAALELGPHNIRVNAVLPGLIPTAIFGNAFRMTHEQALRMVPLMERGASNLAPIPRSGNVRDVAEACVYFASDASGFVTGAAMPVDGGITLKTQMGLEAEQPGTVGAVIAEAARLATNAPGT